MLAHFLGFFHCLEHPNDGVQVILGKQWPVVASNGSDPYRKTDRRDHDASHYMEPHANLIPIYRGYEFENLL